ncbi:hypothetical protein RZS08_28200, partial [Arthrospira platensis SPKY1]|nr:hypothetical protein [Arthrospira platensis SPKY1]
MISVGGRYIPESVYQKAEAGESVYEKKFDAMKRPVDDYIIQNAPTEEGWWYRTYRLDVSAFNSADQAYYYPIIGGYSGAKLSIYQDLIDYALTKGPFGFNPAILNMLNVRYLVAPLGRLPLDGYVTAYQSGDRQVIENQNVLPKAWFVDEVQVVDSPRAAMDAITTASFDPRQT